MKAWGGRFTGTMSDRLTAFSASIEVDQRLYEHDIAGSLAHAKMLAAAGIIGSEDAELIAAGLKQIAQDIRDGRFVFDASREDIHMNIEATLRDRIGEVAGKLHTARSRNDQVALDLHLFVRQASVQLRGAVVELQRRLCEVAVQHVNTVMPGLTHLQPAQPVTLAFHLLAYFFMFDRDRERLAAVYESADRMPLGAAALAGTTFPIDPDVVAGGLGFSRLYDNAADAVSDRDFAVELVAALSVCSLHLSRLAEDIILWANPEWGFCELPDELATGSSIMPQKKNPDAAELIRGKSGRVWGALMNLGMMLKALPLAYNRDLQEDKRPLFDAVDTVGECLEMAGELISGLRFDAVRMVEATGRGFLTATELADYLAARGMPFREAHAIVGRIVRHCLDAGLALADVDLDTLRRFSGLFEEDALPMLDPARAVARRDSSGGTSPRRVREQIAEAQRRLALSDSGQSL